MRETIYFRSSNAFAWWLPKLDILSQLLKCICQVAALSHADHGVSCTFLYNTTLIVTSVGRYCVGRYCGQTSLLVVGWFVCSLQGGHSSGKPGKVRELKSGQAKVRENRKNQGKVRENELLQLFSCRNYNTMDQLHFCIQTYIIPLEYIG